MDDDLKRTPCVGCVKANISSSTQAVAQELMREEIAHITALNNQLRSIGESPSCPLINLGMAFPPVHALFADQVSVLWTGRMQRARVKLEILGLCIS